MTNVYFSQEGMTSTTANYYANIAKEMQSAATEKLNGVRFYNTSVAVIGSKDRQLMSQGMTDLDFIQPELDTLSELNGFCAWVREAIKEKEAQAQAVKAKTMEEWAEEQGIEIPAIPKHPYDPKVPTEQDVMNTWDINKRNKYLSLEAKAATYGKYIHPDGAYSKARKQFHTTLTKPISKEGTGRDTVLFYAEPSIPADQVDSLFMQLQDAYRSCEKELNLLKFELKEEVNALAREAFDKHILAEAEWKKQLELVTSKRNEIRSLYLSWRTSELERISALKITVPTHLKHVFKSIKEAGDTSK